MRIDAAPFGSYQDKPVSAYTLVNAGGLSARLINFGARLVAMRTPDRDGRPADIVLGFDDLAGYTNKGAYFGATCGRYGNRIAGARFRLDGTVFELSRNEGANQLHGGAVGFDKKVWDARLDEDENSVTFSAVSEDGDQGFPGRLHLTSTYTLTDDNRLLVTMSGTSDRPTVLNMVHHSYWNLAGHDSGPVLDQVLAVPAAFYTPVDDQFLTTGEILSVAGTPFDFREPKTIGRDIGAVANARGGYDHNWVLHEPGPGLRPVATLRDPASGRGLALRSTEPGVQIYSGGYLDATYIGKGRHPYCQYAGIALETQKFPGSPNIAHFPSSRLDPGEVYEHRMEMRFFNGDGGL